MKISETLSYVKIVDIHDAQNLPDNIIKFIGMFFNADVAGIESAKSDEQITEVIRFNVHDFQAAIAIHKQQMIEQGEDEVLLNADNGHVYTKCAHAIANMIEQYVDGIPAAGVKQYVTLTYQIIHALMEEKKDNVYLIDTSFLKRFNPMYESSSFVADNDIALEQKLSLFAMIEKNDWFTSNGETAGENFDGTNAKTADGKTGFKTIYYPNAN